MARKARTPAGTASAETATDTLSWLPADRDYQLAIDAGKVVCRNPQGKQLSSLPKWLKDSDLADQLSTLTDWLEQHERQCQDTAQNWMLRSLPVPLRVAALAWPDPAWANALRNLVVCVVADGERDDQRCGFLRDVTDKGLGVIDLDGETQWLEADAIAIPHPILLPELDAWRELAAELDFRQRLDQLFRETRRVTPELLDKSAVDEFSEGRFEQLNHVLGLCRRLGYRVSGGYATCRVWEEGTVYEARYWIGADYPEGETYTGELVFTDAEERSLPLRQVGAVTFSEGMRMAAAIFAKRVVKEEEAS